MYIYICILIHIRTFQVSFALVCCFVLVAVVVWLAIHVFGNVSNERRREHKGVYEPHTGAIKRARIDSPIDCHGRH